MKEESAPRIVAATRACRIFMYVRITRCIVLAVLGLSQCAYADAGHTWRVVILPGADPTQPAAQEQIRAIRQTIAAEAPQGVEFYTDSLDDLRFDDAGLMPSFLALLKRKYEHRKIDIVVGLADFALDFTKRYHDEIWPGAPVVISSVADDRRKDIPSDFAYVPTYFDIDGTIALAETLQPRARRLVVVSGTAKLDLRFAERAANTARARTSRSWTVDVWSGLTVPELQQRLAKLDRDVAVLYTTMYRDRTGRTFFPYEVVQPMAKVSAAPIYGWYPTYMGNGLSAGSVISFDANGRNTGAVAASILLGGSRPQGVISSASAAHCIADVGMMEKLGLDASRLPLHCQLINVPPSLWREYRLIVLGAVAVVLMQTLTIGALLWQRRRRRIAEYEATLRANELARAAQFASAGELSASVAHEIGQPLGAILSNAEAAGLMLDDEVETEEFHSILSDIRRDALRANQVVRRLRALLQKHTIEFVPLDLNSTVNEGLVLLDLEARRRSIVVEVNLAVQDACVRGDRVQIQQVLINLVVNAMDAMVATPLPERIVSISSRRVREGYELIVADRGHGIPPDAGERVFESLYTTKQHGMGLGLSIVRTIVLAHNGQVWAAPRDGGGSIFTVWLPALERRTLSPLLAGSETSAEGAALLARPMQQGGHP